MKGSNRVRRYWLVCALAGVVSVAVLAARTDTDYSVQGDVCGRLTKAEMAALYGRNEGFGCDEGISLQCVGGNWCNTCVTPPATCPSPQKNYLDNLVKTTYHVEDNDAPWDGGRMACWQWYTCTADGAVKVNYKCMVPIYPWFCGLWENSTCQDCTPNFGTYVVFVNQTKCVDP